MIIKTISGIDKSKLFFHLFNDKYYNFIIKLKLFKHVGKGTVLSCYFEHVDDVAGYKLSLTSQFIVHQQL